MKAVTRSTIVGLIVYAGLSFAGYLASTGHVLLAYAVLFVTSTVTVILDRLLTNNDEVD